jgi:hypothetical protein
MRSLILVSLLFATGVCATVPPPRLIPVWRNDSSEMQIYGTALVAYRTTKVPLANEERNQLSYMSDICSEQAWKALPPETARDAQNVTPFMRGCLDVFISQVKTTGLLKDVSLKEVPINADPHQLLPESAK